MQLTKFAHGIQPVLVLPALLLPPVAGASAQTAARLAEGGPPTTIVTPGHETRNMGGGPNRAERSPVTASGTPAPQASGGERVPGRDPGTAQRPTPDQSQ